MQRGRFKWKDTQDTQADLAIGIYVGVEANATAMGSEGFDIGRSNGVAVRKFESEFEEAKLIWGIRWADDEGSEIANIVFTKSYGKRW